LILAVDHIRLARLRLRHQRDYSIIIEVPPLADFARGSTSD
jgi:hypothetical protein